MSQHVATISCFRFLSSDISCYVAALVAASKRVHLQEQGCRHACHEDDTATLPCKPPLGEDVTTQYLLQNEWLTLHTLRKGWVDLCSIDDAKHGVANSPRNLHWAPAAASVTTQLRLWVLEAWIVRALLAAGHVMRRVEHSTLVLVQTGLLPL
jgi:hypothetical protein